MPPPPSSQTTLYTDADSITALLSLAGMNSRVDDDGNGTISPTEQTWITYASNVGTARVNSFASTKYDTSDLATSWSVWNWATVVGSYWLCCRRGNPVPSSIIGLYEEAMNELSMVKAGILPIDDLAMRNIAMPVWANIRLDDRYWVYKMRVQLPMGDQTPNPVPISVDWLSQIWTDPPII